jgi:hypothetical protein
MLLTGGTEVMTMRRFLSALALLAPLVASGCTETGTMVLEIDHYRPLCFGVGRQMCMRVREAGQESYGLFYDGISGLSPEWGYRYTVEVSVTEVPDPPEDGSSVRHSLMSVISKEPVPPDTTFTVDVDGASAVNYGIADLVFDGDTEGRLLGVVPFTCASAAVCDAAEQVQDNGEKAELTFGYPDPVALPLVLLAVEPD